MVKILALPKAPEHQFTKRVLNEKAKYDAGIVKEILKPPLGEQSRVVHVVICQDGNENVDLSYNQNVQKHLQELYDAWGYRAEVRMHTFTFMENTAAMMHVLLQADVFYLAGGWSRRTLPSQFAYCLVEMLRARVQYNLLAFIGVCGGAVIAGKENGYGVTPLDLLQGAKITYLSSSKPTDAEGKISTAGDFVMTSGCAFGINVWQSHTRVASFPVIKNHDKWLDFSLSNSIALESAILRIIKYPEAFSDESGMWYFSLHGCIIKNGLCRPVPWLTSHDLLTLVQKLVEHRRKMAKRCVA